MTWRDMASGAPDASDEREREEAEEPLCVTQGIEPTDHRTRDEADVCDMEADVCDKGFQQPTRAEHAWHAYMARLASA